MSAGVCACECRTSCLALPVNVVEGDTRRVLVSRQFRDEEPHELVDPHGSPEKDSPEMFSVLYLEVYSVAATRSLVSKPAA